MGRRKKGRREGRGRKEDGRREENFLPIVKF
jgi:hypothetical protein